MICPRFVTYDKYKGKFEINRLYSDLFNPEGFVIDSPSACVWRVPNSVGDWSIEYSEELDDGQAQEAKQREQ